MLTSAEQKSIFMTYMLWLIGTAWIVSVDGAPVYKRGWDCSGVPPRLRRSCEENQMMKRSGYQSSYRVSEDHQQRDHQVSGDHPQTSWGDIIKILRKMDDRESNQEQEENWNESTKEEEYYNRPSYRTRGDNSELSEALNEKRGNDETSLSLGSEIHSEDKSNKLNSDNDRLIEDLIDVQELLDSNDLKDSPQYGKSYPPDPLSSRREYSQNYWK